MFRSKAELFLEEMQKHLTDRAKREKALHDSALRSSTQIGMDGALGLAAPDGVTSQDPASGEEYRTMGLVLNLAWRHS